MNQSWLDYFQRNAWPSMPWDDPYRLTAAERYAGLFGRVAVLEIVIIVAPGHALRFCGQSIAGTPHRLDRVRFEKVVQHNVAVLFVKTDLFCAQHFVFLLQTGYRLYRPLRAEYNVCTFPLQ